MWFTEADELSVDVVEAVGDVGKEYQSNPEKLVNFHSNNTSLPLRGP